MTILQKTIIAIVVVSALAYCENTYAMTGAEYLVRGIEAYDNADFNQAINEFKSASKSQSITPRLRAISYFYLGMVLLSKGDRTGAQNAFSMAKGSDHSFTLDKTRFPPKVVQLFNLSPRVAVSIARSTQAGSQYTSKSGKCLRVAVSHLLFEAVGGNLSNFDENKFTDKQLGKMLDHLKGICTVIPGRQVIAPILSSVGLKLDSLLVNTIDSTQMAMLARIMDKLGVDAILIWKAGLLEGNEQISIAWRLYKKNEPYPIVKGDRMILVDKAERTIYYEILVSMTRGL